jgi:site-specific DNA-methyltransferase (adenine-specific)
MSRTGYTEAQKRADKKYTSNTDQLRIRIPKGKKYAIKQHADLMNESVGQFVIRAVNKTMEQDTDYIQGAPLDDIKHHYKINPQYKYTNGKIFNCDCIDFLKNIEDESVDTVFADPPYNIGKADWDDIGTQDEYIKWSLTWLKEASRILKRTGTLYICGFTEILADIRRPAMKYFEKNHWLIWYYDNKANMRNDWGRSHESILCLRKTGEFTFNIDDVRIPYNAHTRKYPKRNQSGKTSQFYNEKVASSTWEPNPRGAKPKDVINIPTTCNGMAERTKHPTQKPEELLRRLILASTNTDEVVVDPFSGSGTTAVVCTQLGRKFIVNDLNREYNTWADNRIKSVVNFDVEAWIEYDKKNDIRRRSIR